VGEPRNRSQWLPSFLAPASGAAVGWAERHICRSYLPKNVAALQDRGHVLFFEPSAAELHRKAGEWFNDREIYQWFGANLHRLQEPSLRYYVRARELKAPGMNWKDALEVTEENRREEIASQLLKSDEFGSTAERVEAFIEQGGGCRATFFNYKKRLKSGSGRR
jgi:hypothetical protein